MFDPNLILLLEPQLAALGQVDFAAVVTFPAACYPSNRFTSAEVQAPAGDSSHPLTVASVEAMRVRILPPLRLWILPPQGKIVVTSHVIAIICAVSSTVYSLIQEFGELGAAGVLNIYLDDEVPIARFGTRWLCQQKFSMGIFQSAKTTQAGVPHFC